MFISIITGVSFSLYQTPSHARSLPWCSTCELGISALTPVTLNCNSWESLRNILGNVLEVFQAGFMRYVNGIHLEPRHYSTLVKAVQIVCFFSTGTLICISSFCKGDLTLKWDPYPYQFSLVKKITSVKSCRYRQHSACL